MRNLTQVECDPQDETGGVSLLLWTETIHAAIQELGGGVVMQTMARTAEAVEDRNYSREAVAMMKWHKIPFWALPRALAIDPNELRLIDDYWHRAWVCELDGVKIDGHVYVAQGSGCCQVCGY